MTNWPKIIAGAYGALFAGVGLWAASFFLQIHREIAALRAIESSNRAKLAVAEARLLQQQNYLTALRSDPALVERVIRRKMGYVRADEYVFRFEEKQ
jgi:cell division protein DivIC